MTTFSRLLQRTYEETPERVALILQQAGQHDQPITYRALLEGAHAYSQALARARVRPGEIVVIILQHGADLILAYWGTILLGAVPSILPFLTEKLSPERYRADLSALIQVTQPSAIITYPEFEMEVRATASRYLPATVERMVEEPPRNVSIVLPHQLEPASAPDFTALPSAQRSPDDVVLLQHSSGTTGLQKGVALSHRAVLNQLDVYAEAIRLDPATDVIVSWLPLYHDMGLIACFIMPILLGVPVVLLSPFDWVRAPYRLMEAVSKFRGTLTWLPNFAYNFCAEMIRPRHMEDLDLSSWRAVVNCSEPVRAHSHAAFYEKFGPYGLQDGALKTCYAMAENVFGVTQSRMDGDPTKVTVEPAAFISEGIVKRVGENEPGMILMSSGRPLNNVELRVITGEGEEAPEGVIGEIILRSNCMLSGYHNRPDATETGFRDGWYLTGDHGFVLEGEVFVSGRKKDVIIVGGKNIYPQDLEALASEVPGVHAGRVVAFGVFDEHMGTEEVVILAEADGADQGEIADAVRVHVTKNSAIALRRVELVPARWILKTTSGKVARSANKDKYLSELNGR